MKIFLENIVNLYGDLVAAAAWVWRRSESTDFHRGAKSFIRAKAPALPYPINFSFRSRPRLGWLAFLCRCRQVGS